MAGAFYPGDVFWQALAGTPSHLALAPLAPFTVWTDQASGSQLTDLTAPDGITALATDGTPGNYLSGSDGLRPDLRSPDQSGILWCESGGHRYPMLPIDVLGTVLQDAALLSYTGGQQFQGPVDFAVAPTVNGALLGGGGGGGGVDATAVHLAGAETITGVKTFNVAPVLPANALSIAMVNLLQSTLDGKVLQSSYQNTNLAYATAFALSTRPTVPTGASIRIWGGLTTDPDPTWMAAGDYRDIPA